MQLTLILFCFVAAASAAPRFFFVVPAEYFSSQTHNIQDTLKHLVPVIAKSSAAEGREVVTPFSFQATETLVTDTANEINGVSEAKETPTAENVAVEADQEKLTASTQEAHEPEATQQETLQEPSVSEAEPQFKPEEVAAPVATEVVVQDTATLAEVVPDEITEPVVETKTTLDENPAVEVVAADPTVEEVLASKPVVEEVIAEEPVVEKVLATEPVVEEVLAAEPIIEEVLAAEPLAEEVPAVEPIVEEVVPVEPVVEEVLVAEPIVENDQATSILVEEELDQTPVVIPISAQVPVDSTTLAKETTPVETPVLSQEPVQDATKPFNGEIQSLNAVDAPGPSHQVITAEAFFGLTDPSPIQQTQTNLLPGVVPDPRLLVPLHYRNFIYDNDSPDVIRAKIAFFRAQEALVPRSLRRWI